MRISRQIQRKAQFLWHKCLVNGMPDDQRVRATVKTVMEQKPRHYTGILTVLLHFVKLAAAERHATIESAIPLPGQRQEEIRTSLLGVHGSNLTFDFVVTPELIGGLRVRVGSDVIDGSVRSRLEQLVNSL